MYWIRTSPWTSAKVMVVASQIAVVRCPARARRTRNAMPPMWTVPLRVMAGFALAAGGDGPAPVRRSAPGGRVARGFAAGGDGVGAVARSGCPGDLGGVPGLLRGDAPGQALVGALGVVDVVEAVDLLLELGDGVGQGLLVQVAEQGLVEALVVARGWWACRVCR